ncbi:helix-turn-helix domain-containing protein [Neisseria wadsworthii]|uniref:helix-turn-helix domain-containing protein n=1 Tax=Neisseria wadsworthii TaxID=607711 RepID=UPI000D31DA2C|nr:RodZ domain-containing protein [Neisseria wadsworthii]
MNINPDAQELGKMLIALREQKGMTLAEAAERLKLPVDKVAALEMGDYRQLPDMVFVRGFLRAYGRLVQADEAVLTGLLDKVAPVSEKNIFSGYKKSDKERYAYLEEKKSFPGWIVAVCAAAVAVGGVFIWQSKSATQKAADDMQAQSSTEQVMQRATELKQKNVTVVPMEEGNVAASAASAASAPAVSAASAASAPSDEQETLVVAADELYIKVRYRTKLVVKDKTGAELVNQIVPAASEHRFKGNAPYDVRIGVVHGSMVNFGGQEINWAPYLVGRTTAVFKAGQ